VKFWLSCFVLLFVGAELFDWATQVEVAPLSGMGLVLGGLGLAAASNAAHLPKLTPSSDGLQAAQASVSSATQTNAPSAEQANSADSVSAKATASGVSAANSESPSIAEQSQEDSISFKVRLPWR
jgi:hypothetical protein